MDLLEHITPHTLILTPNLRLSASLLKKYYQEQIAQGQTCWPTLNIIEISKWLQRTWKDYTAKQIEHFPFLLTPNQEQILWEEILNQSTENQLLQLSSTADLAKSAWGILKQWRIDLQNPALKTTEDGQIFQKWALQFQAICEMNHWLGTHSVADLVTQKIAAGEIPAPEEIGIVGFAELTPQQKFLLETCEAAGSRVNYDEPEQNHHQIQRISLNDKETEIRTMARWAKAIYEKSDSATVACVIPNLEDDRERVIQLFSEVFVANGTYTLDHTTLPFNISAGRSLSAYPVIHTALQLLNFAKGKVSIETLSSMLHSPFLGEAEREIFSRARLAVALRNDNIVTITLSELAEKKPTQSCPGLVKRIKNYIAELPDKTVKRPISSWVTIFMQHLTLWGWPGERSLDSPEYQTAKAWLKLLSEYSGYDPVLGAVNYATALHYLTYLANKAVFQPESPEARIQILGPLEAAALPFDYIWVMGLDDSAWPQSPKPNPFIPQRLQKTLHMPRATAERELIYAKHITEQFKSNSEHVIFSHAIQNDDAELRTSPIIADLPEITLETLELVDFTTPAQIIFASQKIEFLHDETAPSIRENESIRGGSSIFKNQALCPFKAFAELRLHAGKIDPPMPGLRPKDRGEIVHIAMEKIWLELKDQETLLQLQPANLQHLIKTCVDIAIHEIAKETFSNKRYLELESLRLQKLFLDWFELEKMRPNFKIKSLEEERQATLGKIPLTVRADRIDLLENGKNLIIDYKTGKNSPSKDWFDERPNEPQLPLYCILDAENIAGILFAQINPEEMKWKGVSEIPLGIDSVKTLYEEKNTEATSWKEQVEKWKATLEKLGDEFYHGKANVDPKDPVETCQYCHLQTLCRVHENISKI
jgi:ATP-dependent helicase/nuclease subunit B